MMPLSFFWRDIIEIVFFTGVVYSFSVWLKKDQHKNLLGYFYSYLFCFFAAQQLQLPTIERIVVYGAPVMLLLFIVFHQFTLQKNFVALRAITPAITEHDNWLDILMQHCLIAINHNQEIRGIIECTDSLTDCVTTPLALHARVTKELLTLLMSSNSFNDAQMLWLNAHGTLLGMNARWKQNNHEPWLHESTKNSDTWIDEALFYTEKMDALLFKIAPSSHLFTIVVAGKSYSRITASRALTFINHHIARAATAAKKKDIPHVNYSRAHKKQPHEQRRH